MTSAQRVVVAVIDSGIDPERLPPGTAVLPGINLSGDGDAADTHDDAGHGSAVAATILGIAPGAGLLPVKLMDRRGSLRDKAMVDKAFAWISEQSAELDISVICAAFADSSHRVSDESFHGSALQRQIAAMLEAGTGIPTVTAAGNWYPEHRARSPHGMAWPAIIRETVSVGALEHAEEGDRLARASQRLHAGLQTGCSTAIFTRPGEPGMTSGAAAVIAGCIAALRQAFPKASTAQLLERLHSVRRSIVDEQGLSWPAIDPRDLPLR